MARIVKVKTKKPKGVFGDLASAVAVATTIPKGRDRSHDVPIPESKRKAIAAEAKRRAEQAHREEKRAKGQAKVWAAEQAADPLAYLTTPKPKTREPEAIAPYRRGMAPGQQAAARRAARDEARRRRQAARLGALALSDAELKRYPVIGRDPERFLVETMDPVRRRQLEERAVPRGAPPKVRRTPTKRDTQSAGFLGRPEERLEQAGSLFGEVWGDVKDIATGLYGTPVEYGEAFYNDLRHPQLEKGPLSRTTGLAARDALGMLGAYERAIPEFPSWMGGDIQVVEHDPEKGFRFVVRDPDATEQGREAFKESWSRDPLLSALLFVPVAGGVTRSVSVGTLRRSIARANPGLSAKEVNRLARKESRMPGFAAAHGHGGGIPARMVGTPKTTVEATQGAVYEGARGALRYPETGKPGYRFLTTKGARDAVYRDADGVVRGYARATDGGSLKTWVDPDFRRRGIGTNLYETLMRNGVDVDSLSGVGPMTAEGQALAASRGRVAARPYSRSPAGRSVQRSYDYASDLVERYLGPNAKDLSRLGRAGRQVAGRWGTSRRGARAVERGQRKDVARIGAEIARLEQTIRKGGGKKSEYQQALVAALEAPASITIRDAIGIKIKHLASLQTPENRLALQGQIAQLQTALRGKHIDSPEFKAALDAMVELSTKAEGLARSVMGLTPDQLLDRRNRIIYEWQSAGLLDEGVGPARGFFPHYGINEIASSSMTPSGVAATGRTVGVPRRTRALETRLNRLERYGRGAVDVDPKVLANTLRGRVRYQKSQESRRYLYNQGLPIEAGAVIPEEGFYFVRNPDASAKTIPDDVRAVLEDPKRFTEGNEAVLRQWANEWIRPTKDGLQEWSSSLENVRLVPSENVSTALGDVFASAPRGQAASVVGLLNSAARAALIYLPYGGLKYLVRQTPQNLILQALTHPTAFMKVATAVRTAHGNKPLWDAIVVETGGFPAAAGLPERAVRGTRGAQRVERAVTQGSRRWSALLSTATDEPWRVSGWMRYADEWGFKGRYRELLDSTDPNVVRARDTIGQAVKDDLLDFDSLTPGERENISRYLFVYSFQRAALRWPVTFVRDRQTRAAVIGLIASQHSREGAEWGEIAIGGKQTALGWLSPVSQPQEVISSAVEAGQAALEGRADVSALAGMLSPTYRSLITGGGRGGVAFKQLARTFVPGYSTLENVPRAWVPGEGEVENAILRGDENFDQQVQRFLSTRPWRFERSTVGKATAWGRTVAELYGAVSPDLIAAKASKDAYEKETRGKSENERVQWLADRYIELYPTMEPNREKWEGWIAESDSGGLDAFREFLVPGMGWEAVELFDSRIAVVEDANKWLDEHGERAGQREEWNESIANSDDEELAVWRKFLREG